MSPFRGNAFGAVQAFNTWGQHMQAVRGASRLERNSLSMIKGEQAKADEASWVWRRP